jgi:hypothetical protein
MIFASKLPSRNSPNRVTRVVSGVVFFTVMLMHAPFGVLVVTVIVP